MLKVYFTIRKGKSSHYSNLENHRFMTYNTTTGGKAPLNMS